MVVLGRGVNAALARRQPFVTSPCDLGTDGSTSRECLRPWKSHAAERHGPNTELAKGVRVVMDLGAGGKGGPRVAFQPLGPTVLCSKVPPSYVRASLETREGSVK